MRSTRLMLLALLCLASQLGCRSKTGEIPDSKTHEKAVAGFEWSNLPTDPVEAIIFETNFSEDMILDLSPGLKILAQKFEGNQVDLSAVFLNEIEYSGPSEFVLLDAVADSESAVAMVQFVDWPISSENLNTSPAQVWATVTNQFKFDDTQFGVLAGDADRTKNVFRMKVVFEGRLHAEKNQMLGVKAKQTLEWIPVGKNEWKISAWKQDSFEVTYSRQPLFTDVTEQLVPEVDLRVALSRSSHEDLMIERFQNSTRLKNINAKYPHFNDWESSFQYPAISVVDVDGDQWDDLFVMDRWGKSTLLRNQNGESFVDITLSSGLEVDEFANCALFADFDNDGDSDVFVGRTVESSLFFRNENGVFKRDDAVNENLKGVKFVASASLADINRDGLLDVFLGTYCFTAGNREEWVPDAVEPNDELKFRILLDRNNPFLDRAGPPNIVLMNRGGNLERVKVDDTLKQWRNSYQSVWHDVDRDGDPDLYICNDFSPDVFLRNDTQQGSFDPTFVDFTSEIFPEGTMGFGMGASFGDYNSDGELDLYVSNMYSKAGMRIVEKLQGNVDPKIKISAQGNFLYENRQGKFTQVAGLEGDAQHVSKVGWSFGGQLADFNNDAKLDLYVPSGYFTAPKMLASTVDL